MATDSGIEMNNPTACTIKAFYILCYFFSKHIKDLKSLLWGIALSIFYPYKEKMQAVPLKLF